MIGYHTYGKIMYKILCFEKNVRHVFQREITHKSSSITIQKSTKLFPLKLLRGTSLTFYNNKYIRHQYVAYVLDNIG